MNQKNFRVEANYYESLALKKSTHALADDELLYLIEHAFKYESIERLRAMQRRLYAKLGVNEYITRLGQEPVHYEIDGWAASLPLMRAMGLTQIEAPANYADKPYRDRHMLAKMLVKGLPLLFF